MTNALRWAYQQRIQRNAREWQLKKNDSWDEVRLPRSGDFNTEVAEICHSRLEAKEQIVYRPGWDC